MEERDELEQQLLRLRYKMDDMEEEFRYGLREQEEEENNFQYAHRKIKNLIMDYEEKDPEMVAMLEEEKQVINSFWMRKGELEEQFRSEYQRARGGIEEEIYSLQTRARSLNEEGDDYNDN